MAGERRDDDAGLRALALLPAWVPEAEIVVYDLPDSSWRPSVAHTDVGRPDRSARADLFRSAAAALFPVCANLPATAFEAMACGCVVVAADLPPARRWLTDGVNAVLADPSPEALCVGLVRAVTDVEIRDRLQDGASVTTERLGIGWTGEPPPGEGPPAGVTTGPWSSLAAAEVVPGPDRRALLLDQLQPRSDLGGVRLGGPARVGQSFRARFDGLCRIDVMLTAAAAPPGLAGPIEIHVRAHPGREELLATASVPPDEIIAGQWTAFRFAPLADSAGRRYYAELGSPASALGGGPAVALCRADVFVEGRTYVEGRVTTQSLAFRTFCRPGTGMRDPVPGGPASIDPAAVRLMALDTEIRSRRRELERLCATWPYRLLRRLSALSSRRERRRP